MNIVKMSIMSFALALVLGNTAKAATDYYLPIHCGFNIQSPNSFLMGGNQATEFRKAVFRQGRSAANNLGLDAFFIYLESQDSDGSIHLKLDRFHSDTDMVFNAQDKLIAGKILSQSSISKVQKPGSWLSVALSARYGAGKIAFEQNMIYFPSGHERAGETICPKLVKFLLANPKLSEGDSIPE